MKILFSPSKTMKLKNINFSKNRTINFPDKTHSLVNSLKKLSKSEIEKLFKIKGQLLEETYNNIQNFDSLESYEALSLYDGVTFRQLNLNSYSAKDLNYLNENLLIFSALYGVLSPNTEIKPYRLDMTINFLEESLYKFWNDKINDFLNTYIDEIFINLASKEFSKIIDKKKFKVINIEFRQKVDDKLKNISTEAKKARGMLLDFMTINNISDLESIKTFTKEGYQFSESDSNSDTLFFIKE
ncbi:YaaA family protein [Fusobacterium sp.]|uniref:YaaA family protein n=1 Tax=Fusobacterium sp. TaxID=68766 RepID=UPI00260369F6|nr:YaaA family protein [Fusobacterium sp.]